ncbi:MAG: NADP oxidoreductase [Deltaproteobacteria bacterium]|nr:MAG: NADP oxidoreductase [Deltaproteobacteria bacterium]
MRIGIIGAGHAGGAIGTLLADAGHEVLLSCRHPEQLGERARNIGGQCGPIIQAATWGDIILLALPFSHTQDLDMAVKDAVIGKVVIDATNPSPEHDARAAKEVTEAGTGSGTWTLARLYGAKVVKAYNALSAASMTEYAHRDAPRLAIPIASDDADDAKLVAGLVSDCGFDPVVVGELASSASFDPGTEVWQAALTAPELRAKLGL